MNTSYNPGGAGVDGRCGRPQDNLLVLRPGCGHPVPPEAAAVPRVLPHLRRHQGLQARLLARRASGARLTPRWKRLLPRVFGWAWLSAIERRSGWSPPCRRGAVPDCGSGARPPCSKFMLVRGMMNLPPACAVTPGWRRWRPPWPSPSLRSFRRASLPPRTRSRPPIPWVAVNIVRSRATDYQLSSALPSCGAGLRMSAAGPAPCDHRSSACKERGPVRSDLEDLCLGGATWGARGRAGGGAGGGG